MGVVERLDDTGLRSSSFSGETTKLIACASAGACAVVLVVSEPLSPPPPRVSTTAAPIATTASTMTTMDWGLRGAHAR